MSALPKQTEYKQFVNPQQEAFSFLEYLHPEEVPHLHFAHATGFNAYTYRQLFQLLNRKLTIHAMDLRGHGQTKAPADPEQFTSWEPYYQDLTHFLAHLPHPLFLAGHSLGTAVSITIAATHPEWIRGLILIEPILLRGWKRFVVQTLQLLGMEQKIPIAKKASRRRAHFRSIEEALTYYKGRGIFSGWEEPWIEDYLKGGTYKHSDGCFSLTCTPAWESKSFSLTASQTWRNLAKLQCPLLVICGGTQSTFQENDLAVLKKIHPSATIVQKPEATHCFPMEYPEEVAQLIIQFCETHS